MTASVRPFQRLALPIILVLALAIVALAVAGRVQAGGWFVITLDSLPASATAGETLNIGFMLRQHGRTPAYWDGLSLVAENPASGQSVRVIPREQGPVGHYSAEITFPEAGSWLWGIDFERQPWVRWAPLTVVAAPISTADPAAVAATTTQATAVASSWLPLLLALITIVLFLAALQVGRRRRAMGWIVGLAAAMGGLALVMVLRTAPVVVASPPPAPPAPAAGHDLLSEGRALFLAKGCVTCHVHADAPSQGFASTSIGPNLTNYAAPADASFLRQWLADPGSLRPATQMPDLDLSEAEIESLIAFVSN